MFPSLPPAPETKVQSAPPRGSRALQAGLLAIVLLGVAVTPVWAGLLAWGALRLAQAILASFS